MRSCRESFPNAPGTTSRGTCRPGESRSRNLHTSAIVAGSGPMPAPTLEVVEAPVTRAESRTMASRLSPDPHGYRHH